MSGLHSSPPQRCGESWVEGALPLSMSFLVIDDVEPVARMLQEALTRLGHKVQYALTGEEALGLMQTTHFDAILSDLSMPDMNGWTVGERIMDYCGRMGVPKIPFILMTGSVCEIEDDRRLHECGVDALVEKPVDLFWLLSVAQETVQAAR